MIAGISVLFNFLKWSGHGCLHAVATLHRPSWMRQVWQTENFWPEIGLPGRRGPGKVVPFVKTESGPDLKCGL